MLVNVSVIDPVGVQVKLLPAVMLKLPSLSVTKVPLAAPEKVLPPEITWVPEKVLDPLELIFPEIIFAPLKVLVEPEELMFPEMITELEKVLVPE